MQHIDKETKSGSQLSLEALYKIAPSCFTEAKGEDGELHHVVDFTKLRQLLGDAAVDDAPEVYDFTWVGKRSAMREAAAPIRKTLRPYPEESIDWDTTQNLYIEGDNLEVLKLLQNSYMGKVKMIYIDPPYNTGNDFVYHDNFAQSADEYDESNKDEEGNRYRRNTDSNGRFHSDWCSMMYSRLTVSRSLLSDNGAIFISIDDREADNLIKICDEVYGESCFVANVSWQKTYSPRNDSKGIPAEKESIIIYGKNPGWTPGKLPRTAEMNKMYGNPDNDPKGDWRNDNAFASDAKTHQGMVYAIQHPFTGEYIYPYNNGHWRYSQEEMLENMNGWCEYELRELDDLNKRAEICGVSEADIRKGVKAIVLKQSLDISKKKAELVLKRGQWPKFYFTKNGEGGIGRKTFLAEVDGKMATNFWPHSEVGHKKKKKKELKGLFEGDIPFDTPKPVRLLDRIVQIATIEDSIILDFFSGSATTAHAVMQRNSTDNGKRKFILVQIPERVDNRYGNLCEIGKERIRRAGKKIKEENPNAKDLDTGFRVFKCDESNYKDVAFSPKDYTQESLDLFVDNIKDGRSDLDLLFDCMLRWGVELSMPLKSTKVDGCTIHNVDDGNLVACFDGVVTEKVIDAIAAMSPVRVVFRDSSFTEAAAKMNLFELFKQKCSWSETEVKNNIRVI